MVCKTRFLGLAFFMSLMAIAGPCPRVDEDLVRFDEAVSKMKEKFSQNPSDPQNPAWVNTYLAHMVEVDQYLRLAALNWPYEKGYSKEEKDCFWSELAPRWKTIDEGNTGNITKLLTIYDWFRISKFGKEGDNNGWLLVQHADQNPEFQKSILVILEKLYPLGESSPANFAYLWDRVCASWQNPLFQKLQRYGTQGKCVGPGKWEPIPVEDPEHVDERRKSMGLPPMSEYVEYFKEVCKSANAS